MADAVLIANISMVIAVGGVIIKIFMIARRCGEIEAKVEGTEKRVSVVETKQDGLVRRDDISDMMHQLRQDIRDLRCFVENLSQNINCKS